MREIPLSQRKVAVIDDRDFPFINSFKWYAKQSREGKWYAVRMEKGNRCSSKGLQKEARPKIRRRRAIRMHNAIMNPPKGAMVHHKNNDGLINLRSNLEICNPTINRQYVIDEKRKQEDDIPF